MHDALESEEGGERGGLPVAKAVAPKAELRQAIGEGRGERGGGRAERREGW